MCRCHHKMNRLSVCFVTDTQIATSCPTLRPTNAQWLVDRVLGTKLINTVLYYLIIITTQHTHSRKKGENVCQSHYCLCSVYAHSLVQNAVIKFIIESDWLMNATILDNIIAFVWSRQRSLHLLLKIIVVLHIFLGRSIICLCYLVLMQKVFRCMFIVLKFNIFSCEILRKRL